MSLHANVDMDPAIVGIIAYQTGAKFAVYGEDEPVAALLYKSKSLSGGTYVQVGMTLTQVSS